MNCISYSLFGHNTAYENCYEWKSYLRSFHLNVRIAELLYPGWEIFLSIDEASFKSKYFDYFNDLFGEKVMMNVMPAAELCRMMLYRLCPIFENAGREIKYESVLCRDTDSLLSYRERQAIEYWMRGTKMAHSLTDSVSHNIPLMGGMCSFKSGPFRDRMGVQSFDELLALSQGIDYNRKGADQDFLNRYVLPKVHDSITEHFVLGHPQTFRGDCHNFIHNVDLKEIGVPDELKETNGYGFHIGASGYQTDAVVKFLEKHGKDNVYWEQLEKQYPSIFYWRL